MAVCKVSQTSHARLDGLTGQLVTSRASCWPVVPRCSSTPEDAAMPSPVQVRGDSGAQRLKQRCECASWSPSTLANAARDIEEQADNSRPSLQVRALHKTKQNRNRDTKRGPRGQWPLAAPGDGECRLWRPQWWECHTVEAGIGAGQSCMPVKQAL